MGKLVDADEIIDSLGCSSEDSYCREILEEAPPVITEEWFLTSSGNLPFPGKDVLLSVKNDKFAREGHMRTDHTWKLYKSGRIYSADEVVAWRDLPEAYAWKG